MTGKKVRVLLVNADALLRKKIVTLINESITCEVIAVARDGYEALHIGQYVLPDVIVLDIQLPKMDGLTCLAYIMSEWPAPVIMLAAYTPEDSQIAMSALQLGAIDVVTKPANAALTAWSQFKEDLLNKISVAAKVSKEKLVIPALWNNTHFAAPISTMLNKVIAIGASTGGPMALTQLLAAIPSDIMAGILVIQHMPKFFIKAFAERLNLQSELYVKEAEDGEPILASKVLVAPAEFEMHIVKGKRDTGLFIELKKEKQRLHHLSPSIDKTFNSMALACGANAIGVILTGMGKDGAAGCKAIKEHGGTTFAEDRSTCVVYGMSAAAVKAGAIDHLLPLNELPNAIIAEVRRVHGK